MVKHHCCVVGCTSASAKLKKLWKYPHMKHVLFYPFPTKPTERSLWKRLVRRENFEVTRHTRICSLHWISGTRSESEPHPSLFPHNARWKDSPGRASSVRHSSKREEAQGQCVSLTDYFEPHAATHDATSKGAKDNLANEMVIPTNAVERDIQVDDVAYHEEVTSKWRPYFWYIGYRWIYIYIYMMYRWLCMIVVHQAPVPLTIFRSNSNFHQN